MTYLLLLLAMAQPPKVEPVPMPVGAPKIELPENIQGLPSTNIAIIPVTNGKVVKYAALDAGIVLFPSELLANPTTTFVIAAKPGRYRLLAYTAIGDVPSEPKIVVVVVGASPNPNPGPNPGPGPLPPPQPDDELLDSLKSIYGGLQEDDKEKKVLSLVAVYKEGARLAAADNSKSVSDVFNGMRATSNKLLGANDIRTIRERCSQELNSSLPKDLKVSLDSTLRDRLVEQFNRVGSALEGVVK